MRRAAAGVWTAGAMCRHGGLGYSRPMPAPLLADAFGHHVWATLRLLEACATLDDEQLATTVPGTYGSILDTLRHIVDGDVFYLNVLMDRLEPFDEVRAEIPTMRAVMEAHAADWQNLLAGDIDPVTDVIEREENGWQTHAPLGIRLAQALHHGTDHRSQIGTALTTLGIEPPDTDVWEYGKLDGRFFHVEPGGGPG